MKHFAIKIHWQGGTIQTKYIPAKNFFEAISECVGIPEGEFLDRVKSIECLELDIEISG